MDAWVREGAFPTAQGHRGAFGSQNGQESFFKPAEWPAPEAIDEG